VEPLTSARRCRRMLDEIWDIDHAPAVAALMETLVVGT
jgi:hypothetical protein